MTFFIKKNEKIGPKKRKNLPANGYGKKNRRKRNKPQVRYNPNVYAYQLPI